MFDFDVPVSINGTQLIAELSRAGVELAAGSKPLISNSRLWLDIAEAKVSDAAAVVAAHVAVFPAVSERQALLDKLGITEDEARLLLS
jgi:hypothetical protein